MAECRDRVANLKLLLKTIHIIFIGFMDLLTLGSSIKDSLKALQVNSENVLSSVLGGLVYRGVRRDS